VKNVILDVTWHISILHILKTS